MNLETNGKTLSLVNSHKLVLKSRPRQQDL